MLRVSGINNQLKEEMIKVLDAATEVHFKAFVRFQHEYAFYLLSRAGYVDPDNARTTLKGLNYLEQLKYPKRVWLKKNWFAVSIATITGVLAFASVIVQIIALILD